ncbi:MAG: ABC transporter permease [Candidatus Bathyarchaeales archaeon]
MSVRRFKETFKQLLAYKSAVVGLCILGFIIGLSIYAVVTIPYEEAVRAWRLGEDISINNPRNAAPNWINLFLQKKLPETIIMDTLTSGSGARKAIVPGETLGAIRIEFSFEFNYDDFPSELNLFLTAKYNETAPYITIDWIKPDGETIRLNEMIVKSTDRYYISIDSKLATKLDAYLSEKIGQEIPYEIPPQLALFAVEDESLLKPETAQVLKGKYKMVIQGILFESSSDMDAKLVVYGKVFGLAGTDHLRRDLMVALLWGAPIAVSFGVLASVSISLLQMIIAAVSAWYGRWADMLLQKATEFNMILPFLPILMMIAVFYKLSIWVLLVVVIALSIFGSGVKTYRAMFLQVKELPYIEAAQTYGASSVRIIFRYMIPKVLPTIIPSLVLSVSGFVFLEAALAIMGLGDPTAPTWGKIINDAYNKGALYKGYFYWVLEPSFLLVLTALGFAMLGFALDKIFNPKLREM